MLAAISMATSGISEVIRTNKTLSNTDRCLLLSAIENNETLTNVFSLGDEIAPEEIESRVRKMNMRMDAMKQALVLEEALKTYFTGNPKLTPEELKERKSEMCSQPPDVDSLWSEAFGNDYI